MINNKCPLPFSEPTSCGELEKAYKQGGLDMIDEILSYKYCVYDDDGIGHIVVNVTKIEELKEQR